ncbi:MAG: phage Gp37/Gp68 family protein [Candidatus Hydrogenedentes bacterium]|nr:phage Gp37/Gp68 family protein [Candidatus Hydrogenedentota bacterium]
MALASAIEWTEATWNPITGCSKVSPGCKHCYAERLAKRLQAMGQPNYVNGFELTVHEQMLSLPFRWREPRRVFVNSMSDLFHEAVPVDFIRAVFEVMYKASWHTFQILTKRSRRLLDLSPMLSWQPNIWMGVSVEHEKYQFRINDLRETGAQIKFLSLEPLLGRLSSLDLERIDWVIVGGESGPGARPMRVEWAREIRDQCQRTGTPFFFKQWGGIIKSRNGRQLDGQLWDEMPGFVPSPPTQRELCLR